MQKYTLRQSFYRGIQKTKQGSLCLVFSARTLFLLSVLLSSCSSKEHLPVVWEFATNYALVTMPSVEGRFAVFGSDKLYCVDATSGTLIWTFETFGPITSQPVIRDGRVFFQCGGLYCLELATGKLLWEFWTEAWGETTPAVSDTMVACTQGENLFCIDAATGKKLVAVPVGKQVKAPLLIGSQMLVCGQTELRCIDATAGTVQWSLMLPGESEWLHIAAVEEHVYLPVEGGVKAVDILTGEVRWFFPIPDIEQIPSCAVTKDFLYVVFGTVYCLDKKTGAVVWHYNPPKPLFVPIVDGDVLYATNITGRLSCIDLKERKILWTVKGARRGTFQGGYFYRGSAKARAYCMKLPVP